MSARKTGTPVSGHALLAKKQDTDQTLVAQASRAISLRCRGRRCHNEAPKMKRPRLAPGPPMKARRRLLLLGLLLRLLRLLGLLRHGEISSMCRYWRIRILYPYVNSAARVRLAIHNGVADSGAPLAIPSDT